MTGLPTLTTSERPETPEQLLTELRDRGIVVWAEGERVRFRAPLDRGVSVADIKAIKHFEPELVALLGAGLQGAPAGDER